MDNLIYKDSLEVVSSLRSLNHRFSGKTVLLTGAAGFLGIHFVHYFAALNAEGVLQKPVKLWALDNFQRGLPDWVHDYQVSREIDLIKADVTQPLNFQQPFDFIFHAASIASPIYYRQHPIETMDANIIGLRRLLDYSLQYIPESFLFFSSSEIYGDPLPQYIPTPETYNGNVSCTGPRACYDESKRFGETLCVNFHQVHSVPLKVCRPFNNYGPGLKISDRRLLPDFFRDILAERDLVMYSDGSPTRTFCYVTDAITGYLLALLSTEDGQAFNIGIDQPEISVQDLAELVIRISGKSLKVVCQTSPDSQYLTDNPNRRCPDITKARRLLGYEPKIGLEEGLSRLYQWYLANPESPEG
jgi:nucleoside-diphosphate-sugar epimerase